MQMPERSFIAQAGYRYGFNGKELDNDLSSLIAYDYGFRIYNPGIGKFLSVDPFATTFPELTPFQFSSNNPILFVDIDGLELGWKDPTTGKMMAAEGPTAIPVGTRNKQGWVLCYYPITRSEASSQKKEAPIRNSAIQLGNDNFASMNAARSQQIAQQRQKAEALPEPVILEGDMFGNAVIGPQSVVRAKIRSIRASYYEQIGDNIRSGPFGAIGYMAAGDRGSFYGASIDGVVTSFGGVQGGSPIFSRPTEPTDNGFVPYTEISVPSQARRLLSRALQIQGLNSAPNEFKQKWSEGGYDYEVRIHGPDSGALAGSNSASNTTFIVARRLQGRDAKGQGFGWERADDKGGWHKVSDLKASGNAANDTHIPLNKPASGG